MYIFESSSIKLVIKEDLVGFYLIIYKNPTLSKSSADYLLDSLAEAFEMAQEKYGVSSKQFVAV